MMLAAALLLLQAAPVPPVPPEVRKLDYFVGTWTTHSDIKPGPLGPGGAIHGTQTCSWFEGGLHVVCRSEGTSPVGPIHGLALLRWDPETKRYAYYAIGSGGQADLAQGTVEGDTWTWTSEGRMGGQSFKSRFTMKTAGADAYSTKWEMALAGASWLTLMDGTNKRRK